MPIPGGRVDDTFAKEKSSGTGQRPTRGSFAYAVSILDNPSGSVELFARNVAGCSTFGDIDFWRQNR